MFVCFWHQAPGRWTPLSVHNAFNSAFPVEGAALFKVLFHLDHTTTAVRGSMASGCGLRLACTPVCDGAMVCTHLC